MNKRIMTMGNAPRRSGCALLACLALLGSAQVQAQDKGREGLVEKSVEVQQNQAQLQQKIDAADDATREALRELRRVEREAQRLEAYNDELARQVDEQGKAVERRQRAVEQLANAEQRLPVLTRQLAARLERLVAADMPFLYDQRQARLASLNRMLDSGELSAADKLDRVLAAWRAELDYGREVDAWQGSLKTQGDSLEVDYLRLGRLGWYYLTPDGQQGGVWRSKEQAWQALDDEALGEVRKGLRIAREERVPAMLDLPLSVTPQQGQLQSSQQSQEDAS
ncbi:DUF3450 domain-containing protein [Halomonas sp. IOP_31]|uniref:DUF3450 domain-containing protein n=1 Tax=Halomonas sp. IOP_31 TaxID=2876584 RepID=UPI001E531F64|nr:DUF3450 domain-containing protein [Halomonas sp. IOP_31]